jgi:copper oxidase (laccase) domain-containing protein
VGGEVREIFLESGTSALAKESIARAFVASKTQDKFQADLYALASQRLVSAGVREIEGGGLCTFCDPERFYSYRREPVCGRMLSMIYIK